MAEPAKSGTSKAANKTLTKKKLNDFNKANSRESHLHNQNALEYDNHGSFQSDLETLSESGHRAASYLLSVLNRAHKAAVFP